MTEKHTITLRDTLAHLQQATGRLSDNHREVVSEALRRVPERWPAAAADQPFDGVWSEALSRSILALADQLLVEILKADSDSQNDLRLSRARSCLGNLAITETVTTASDDLPAHDQV